MLCSCRLDYKQAQLIKLDIPWRKSPDYDECQCSVVKSIHRWYRDVIHFVRAEENDTRWRCIHIIYRVRRPWSNFKSDPVEIDLHLNFTGEKSPQTVRPTSEYGKRKRVGLLEYQFITVDSILKFPFRNHTVSHKKNILKLRMILYEQCIGTRMTIHREATWYWLIFPIRYQNIPNHFPQ